MFYGRASSYLVSRGQWPSPQSHLSHRYLILLPETLSNGHGALLFGHTESPWHLSIWAYRRPFFRNKAEMFLPKGPSRLSTNPSPFQTCPRLLRAAEAQPSPSCVFLLGCGPALVKSQYMGPSLAEGPGEVADISEGECNQARRVQSLKGDQK